MVKTSNKLISIIIPCFNEEGNIKPMYERLNTVLRNYNTEIIFIDDCSNDNTLANIEQISGMDDRVRFVSFSRNFGHQSAIKAGLDYAKGDCVISIDADLQHPPQIIEDLIKKWEDGYEVVYTVRLDDHNTAFFKKRTAKVFYSLLNSLSDVNIDKGTADFRLLDRRIVEIFRNSISEYHLFYRGLISWVGYNQIGLPYSPNVRLTGNSKFTYIKMLSFALDGITSFSIRPLKLASVTGLLITFVATIYAIYVLYAAIFTEHVVQGWSSVLISILFLGGMNMVLLGIIGEYIGKIYMQSKKRPHYLVKKGNIHINKL